MVWVDSMRARYGRMVMCHMGADSLDELHRMADRIGVDRRHFQGGRRPHYDICQAKRRLAVKFGAEEISMKEFALRLKRQRETREPQ